jgi:hypothetical protein
VGDAVQDEIGGHALELIPVHDGGAGVREDGGELQVLVGGGGLQREEEFAEEIGEIVDALLELQFAGVGLGEKHERLDDLAEALDIVHGGLDGFAVFLGGAGVEEGDFELTADAGDGGAEFVGGVDGELAHLFEVVFEAVHHLVEAKDQMLEFIAGAGRGDAELEVVCGDEGGGLGDIVHGLEGAAGQIPTGGADEQQHDGQEQEVDPDAMAEEVVEDIDGGADAEKVILTVLVEAAHADDVAGAAGAGPLDDEGAGGGERLAARLVALRADGAIAVGDLDEGAVGTGEQEDAANPLDGVGFFGVGAVVLPEGSAVRDAEVHADGVPFLHEVVRGVGAEHGLEGVLKEEAGRQHEDAEEPDKAQGEAHAQTAHETPGRACREAGLRRPLERRHGIRLRSARSSVRRPCRRTRAYSRYRGRCG